MFRLVYELVKREFMNKAIEVISFMSWSEEHILKAVMGYSQDKRICRMIEVHLEHGGMLSDEEK